MSKTAKRIIVILSIVLGVIILLLIHWRVIGGLLFYLSFDGVEIETIQEMHEIELQDGEELIIKAQESGGFGVPETHVNVFYNGTMIESGRVNGWGDEYFLKMFKEYHSEGVHIYEFDWGMIYSDDDQKSYKCILEADFKKLEVFYEAYGLLNK